MNFFKTIIVLSPLLIFMDCSLDDSSVLNPTQDYKLLKTIQLPKESVYNRIKFFDNNIGWVTGLNGIIYKTTNGGESWSLQNTGISEDIWQLKFIDERTLWLTTVNSVYKSIDGGSSWATKLSNVEFSRFVAMDCFDENTVWVSGTADGQIMYTSDSGANWQFQKVDTLGRIVSLSFLNKNEGFALSNITGIYKTTNSGFTWSNIPTPRFCSTIFFLNSLHGFAGNNVMPSSVYNDHAQIFRTEDNGNSWNSKIILDATSVWEVRFINEQFGLAIAGSLCGYGEKPDEWMQCGKLYYTKNGGENWSDIKMDSSSEKFISFSLFEFASFAALSIDGEINIFSLY